MIFREYYGRKYLTKLPVAGVARVRYSTGVELLRMKAGTRKRVIGNLEVRSGLPLLIHSKETGKYWYRTLKSDHDFRRYLQFIKEGMLYILFEGDHLGVMSKERDKMGMGYYDYQKIWHLMILKEKYEKVQPVPDNHKVILNAIDIEINKVKQKYETQN
jgi:hypothetical protein